MELSSALIDHLAVAPLLFSIAGVAIGIVFGAIPGLNQGVIMPYQCLAEYCGYDAPVGTAEKLDLEVQLQVLDHFRRCGLRYSEFLCRVLDVSVRANRYKQPQLPEFQAGEGTINDAGVATGHSISTPVA